MLSFNPHSQAVTLRGMVLPHFTDTEPETLER